MHWRSIQEKHYKCKTHASLATGVFQALIRMSWEFRWDLWNTRHEWWHRI